MAENRDIKTICDEICYRVGELAGLAIKADIEDSNRKLEESQAENAELKERVEELEGLVLLQKRTIENYKTQNEKMRCCGNCTNVRYECGEQVLGGKCDTCTNLSNWEM